MRFVEAIVALGALASHTTAFEAEDGAAVTLAQVDTGIKIRRDVASELKRAILKFGGNVSSEIENAIAMAGKKTGTVQNRPEPNDALYLTPTKIGTPPKTFMMDIDSGSADLWVYSTFQSARQRRGHPLYNPGKSSSARRLGRSQFSILYGDGSRASGPVYLDKVSLGGVTVPNQAVGAARRTTGTITNDRNNDGLFGFAFSSVSTVHPSRQNTWFGNAKLKRKVFCADLRHGKPGFYDFGFVNKKHYSGKIHYAPITRRNGFWEFPIGGVSFKGKTIKRRFNAIADTGTSINLLPDSLIRPYYNKIRTAYYESQIASYIYACSENPPAYTFKIAGVKRTIPGNRITFGFAGTVNGRRYCLGGFQRNVGLQGLSIVGDTFLKTQYVVFDGGKNRIGFANKA